SMKDYSAHALYSCVVNDSIATCDYVNFGTKSLLHETQVQDFTVDRLGFRRMSFTEMRLHYRRPYGLVRLAHPLRRLVGRVDPRVGALLTQDAIARQYARSAPARHDVQ